MSFDAYRIPSTPHRRRVGDDALRPTRIVDVKVLDGAVLAGRRQRRLVLVAPVDAVNARQMCGDVLNGTRSHALVPDAQIAVVRGRQQIARDPIETDLSGAG